MSKPIAVCLPMSPLDSRQGMELARLWADIQPAKDDNIEIIIALRYDMDTAVIPPDVIPRLQDKFGKVYVIKSALKGAGFPHGCNALEIGAYQWYVENNRSGIVKADYLLLAEPDTVPLRPTWISEIADEAHRLNAPITGALWTQQEGCHHINGNCVMHKDFWRKCRIIWSVPPGYGWDVYIGKVAVAIGKPSRMIFQDYHLGTPHNPWKGDDFIFAEKRYPGDQNPLYGQALQPAMLHGIKTMQGIDAVRKKFGLPARII